MDLCDLCIYSFHWNWGNDCLTNSEVILKDMDKIGSLPNHNKAQQEGYNSPVDFIDLFL